MLNGLFETKIFAKSHRTLFTFFLLCLYFIHLIAPSIYVCFGRRACDNGKISLAEQFQLFRERKYNDLGGIGLQVKCNDGKVKRNMAL